MAGEIDFAISVLSANSGHLRFWCNITSNIKGCAMNWEAVGAIGEILGALAVFVTLVYLAVQVRQVKSELHTSGFREISTLLNETSASITPEIARTLAKIEKKEPLEDWEKILCDEFFYRLTNTLEVAWEFAISGTMDLSKEDAREVIAWYLKRPGLKQWWPENKGGFFASFQEFVDDCFRAHIA